MKPKTPWKMLGAATGSALVGAICGALLAAWGNTVSTSPLGAGAVLVLATGLGALSRRFSGVFLGAICGVLLAAFGFLVGGTILGVVLTITGCALLAAWLQWVYDNRLKETKDPPNDFRHQVNHVRKWTFCNTREKEHVR
jgi:hypothetical protein